MPLLSDPNLFDEIASMHASHARNMSWWRDMNKKIEFSREELRDRLTHEGGFSFGPLGPIQIEYVEMGAVSTLDLFGLDELIIFAFYWKNRNRYRKVVDMGANIGLHTVVLGLMGYDVTSYEPDPETFVRLQDHIVANELSVHAKAINAAVDTQSGTARFVRVLGNTTGSHLSGAKPHAYGDLKLISVPTVAFAEAVRDADFAKIDVEGVEARLLTTLTTNEREHLDVICEVGSTKSAQKIWSCLQGTSTRFFSQKRNWSENHSSSHLPETYRDGSLFLTTKSRMTWN